MSDLLPESLSHFMSNSPKTLMVTLGIVLALGLFYFKMKAENSVLNIENLNI